HPGDHLESFTRLLLALSIGLAMLAQSGVVNRVGGPFLVERVVAAAVVGLLMFPEIEIRANIMLAAIVAVLVTALTIERRRDPIHPSSA
ncbi:MAG: hypothetical protein JJE47_16635, partial [Acidimicrobiia bacterium]|nr:hypothetical protein [Acidimicrobiia bacterium]